MEGVQKSRASTSQDSRRRNGRVWGGGDENDGDDNYDDDDDNDDDNGVSPPPSFPQVRMEREPTSNINLQFHLLREYLALVYYWFMGWI